MQATSKQCVVVVQNSSFNLITCHEYIHSREYKQEKSLYLHFWKDAGALRNTYGIREIVVRLKGELSYELTDRFDNIGQNDAVRHVHLQILNVALTSRLFQVVIGPVRVDLQRKRKNSDQTLETSE